MSILLQNAQPGQTVANPPIIQLIDPPVGGPAALQYPLGTVWINAATDVVFTLTSFTNGVPFWQNTQSGGSTFTSLTVTPGPTAITGQFRVNGNVNEADVIELSANAGASETIVIESLQGTGAGAVAIESVSGGIQVSAGLNIAIDATGDVDLVGANVNANTGMSTGNTTIGNVANGGAVAIDSSVSVGLLAANVNLNTGTSTGATTIGNAADGGVVTIDSASVLDVSTTNMTLSASAFDVYPTTTMLLGDVATITTIDVGNITPTVSRTTTINGAAVIAAHTDTLNLATGGVNTNASANKVVNIASGATLLGNTDVNIASGTVASGTNAVAISTGSGGGTKTVGIGNIDALTTITEYGVVNINTSTSPGATTIGNNSAGGAVGINSTGIISLLSNDSTAGAISLRATGAAGTIQIAPDANTIEVDIAKVVPTASRVTYINDGTVASNVTDGTYIGHGATSTNAGAAKFVDIGGGNNLLGTTTVEIATGTTVSGTKRIDMGNVDGLTAINQYGVVGINNSTSTGATTIGTTAHGGAIALASAAGITSTSTTQNLIQSTQAANTAVKIYASDPIGGVLIQGATTGNVSIANDQIAGTAGPSATVATTLNARVGSVTYAGYTQAAAATLTITLTNAFITATSVIFAQMTDVSSNVTAMQLSKINPGAGSAVITFTNNGSQAVNGNLQLNFWVLS